MCLCNVLFLIKYKTHVFSIFRIFREQKYKHMIFELKLVFEVQVFSSVFGQNYAFLGQNKTMS